MSSGKIEIVNLQQCTVWKKNVLAINGVIDVLYFWPTHTLLQKRQCTPKSESKFCILPYKILEGHAIAPYPAVATTFGKAVDPDGAGAVAEGRVGRTTDDGPLEGVWGFWPSICMFEVAATGVAGVSALLLV